MELWNRVREHPFITAILLFGAAAGAALSLELGPGDMSPTRRIVGGIIAGLGIALTVVFSRAAGAFGEDGS